jgi:peroxiredoxin
MKKLILSLFVFSSAICVSYGQSPFQIGDKAQDFSLLGIDNKMHSMADYAKAKGFIIVFTCNHCPFSVAYEDRIVALHNTYSKLGYHVIAINPNDTISYPEDNFSNMCLRAKSKGFEFPYLIDASQTIYPKFGATKTPHVFLLDAQRILRYMGAIDDATKAEEVEEKYLEKAIESLIKGKDVSPQTTKAIGCSIKVRKTLK